MRKCTIIISLLLILSTVAVPVHAAKTSSAVTKIAKEVTGYVDKAHSYLGAMAKSGSFWSKVSYWSKALSAFNKARTIGKGLNELVIYRDRTGEQAYDQGYKDGKRDAVRFRDNPRQGYVDVCNRCYYAKRGLQYGACYDAGYSEGFTDASK